MAGKDESGKGRWRGEYRDDYRGGYGDYYAREYKEEFRRGDCKIKRKWKRNGEYQARQVIRQPALIAHQS